MGLNANELTELSKNTAKARRNLDNLLDFVDLINNDAEKLEGNVVPPGEKIKELSAEMSKYVDEIRDLIDTELDRIPIDPEVIKEAAEKLNLYHGDINQVLAWADGQKSNYKENSYWWRYWVGIIDSVMNHEMDNPSEPMAKGIKFMEKIK